MRICVSSRENSRSVLITSSPSMRSDLAQTYSRPFLYNTIVINSSRSALQIIHLLKNDKEKAKSVADLAFGNKYCLSSSLDPLQIELLVSLLPSLQTFHSSIHLSSISRIGRGKFQSLREAQVRILPERNPVVIRAIDQNAGASGYRGRLRVLSLSCQGSFDTEGLTEHWE